MVIRTVGWRCLGTISRRSTLTLSIVFAMLLINRGSAIEALIILIAIPFSLIGAVWFLWLLDEILSWLHG